MSLLAVNIGNSHTVLGIIDDAEVRADWRVATDGRRTADEWAVLVHGLLGERQRTVTGIVVCATVPAVLREWREMLQRHFGELPAIVVEPGVRTGIPLLMDNPREVGTDRIANVLGALTHFGRPAIVVDVGGTATTIDVVNADGKYIGGAIATGIEISLAALESHGAQLRRVELALPRTTIATNTVEALQSGLLFGMAAQVDGLVARMSKEIGSPSRVPVIATGYLAPLILPESGCFTDHDPWLTLRGLECIYDRNIGSRHR